MAEINNHRPKKTSNKHLLANITLFILEVWSLKLRYNCNPQRQTSCLQQPPIKCKTGQTKTHDSWCCSTNNTHKYKITRETIQQKIRDARWYYCERNIILKSSRWLLPSRRFQHIPPFTGSSVQIIDSKKVPPGSGICYWPVELTLKIRDSQKERLENPSIIWTRVLFLLVLGRVFSFSHCSYLVGIFPSSINVEVTPWNR